MPPQLALLLCTGFVLWLLWIEYKQSSKFSAALWVPTLWMMYSVSRPLAAWFGGDAGQSEGAVEAGSPIDRMFLTALIGLSLLVIARRGVNWASIRKHGVVLLVICGYALISIAWSDFTFVSIKRYIRFCGSPLIAFMLLTESSPREAMESVLRRTAYVLVPFSMMLIKYYPNIGVMFGRWSGERMWVGVTSQKNGLGILCFVSIFFLFWALFRRWTLKRLRRERVESLADFLVLGLALVLLKGPEKAHSATSMVVTAVGLMMLLGLYRMYKRRRFVTIGAIYALVGMCFLYGIGIPFGSMGVSAAFMEFLGRDATFTDRDQIWHELVPIAMHNPVLGQGYGGFWVIPIASGVNEAHNGYLDLMLEQGAVGLVLLFIFFLSLCKTAYRDRTKDFWWSSLALAFSIMILIHNTTESSFMKTSNFLWTLMIILFVLIKVDRAKAPLQVRTTVEVSPEQSQPAQPA